MHPVLLRLPFGLTIYSYGTMLGISFVVGWSLTLALGERDGLDRRSMERCFWWTAAAAMAGARVLYFIARPSAFTGPLDLLRIGYGGIVAYGGFLGGFFASLFYCRLRRLPLLIWADAVVPSLASGLAITRIGCFLAGCDFGKFWDGPLAVRFPPGSPAYEQQLGDGLLLPSATASLPVHPTQLYESLAGLLLLALVFRVRSRPRRVAGEAFVAFTLAYAVLRSAIEVLRDDRVRGAVGPFSTSQIVGAATFLAALALLAWIRRAARTAGPASGARAGT